jgi:voltage-gated sodium channel
MVLNLFIGVVVNAMQREHEKAEKLELEQEREIVHEETAPILREVLNLKAEIAELRKALAGKT